MDRRAKIEGKLNIFQSDNNIIFETKGNDNQSDIYYETGPTYTISTEGYHLGVSGDTDQTASVSAVLNLDFFNCFAWGNGFESYRIKDDLAGNAMLLDTRPNTSIDEYKQNVRRSSITYSGKFERSTGYNSLNEFNLSRNNFIDLDDSYGSIQYLHSRETDLVAIQENNIQPLGS